MSEQTDNDQNFRDQEVLACVSLHAHATAVTLYDFHSPSLTLSFLSPWLIKLAEETRNRCKEMGAEILFPFHPKYPDAFLQLETPPLFISVLGPSTLLSAEQRLAIVGSRNLSARVEEWMSMYLPSLYEGTSTPVIVSGGARGADQAAHLAAVRAKKPTICFLPSGLGVVYPPSLSTWVQPILETGGCIVSQFAPNSLAKRHHFERRNELIVALGHGVFVVEASRRSGSMMTARIAMNSGREIAVIPSFPGDAIGTGSLDLVRAGVEVICDGTDLIAFMERARPLIPRTLERHASRDRE